MPALRALPMLLPLALLVLAPAAHAAPRDGGGRAASHGSRAEAGMVRLPAGSYRPLYGRPGDPAARIAAFRLDRDVVTRGQYLEFVRAHPEWRRGVVRPLFAARDGYLADWAGDLDAGDAAALRRPVTGVSWFAARAYCAAAGKRLPTAAEWEYAGAASTTARDATRDPAFMQQLVTVYASRPRQLPAADAGARNAYGVRGMHDLVWEWVDDFNSVLVSDDSRGVGGRDHDMFCASAAIGAVDPSNYPAFLRYAVRAGLTGRSTMGSLGFRCAS